MALLSVIPWGLVCGLLLYGEHLLFSSEPKLARYIMGTAALLSSFSCWVLTAALLLGQALIWQDVILAVWGMAGVGLLVVGWLHWQDDRNRTKRAAAEAEKDRYYEAGKIAGQHPPSYPHVDQDI